MGILKGEGFEVETVSNGVAAIKRLAVLHPVAILADVSMPGRDGYEVCDYVKKSPALSHVPVLLVASDMEPYDSARGAEVRADGIIKKPFEARELISIVVKFAEQFEAATIAIPEAPVAPPPMSEPKEEFAALGDGADNTPTVVQHVDPDFSAHAGGVAFAEPIGEEAHAFSLEPHPDESGVPFAAPQADAAVFPESVFELPSPQAEEHPLAAEAPWDPSSYAPLPPPHYSGEVPSFLEGLKATSPEPVFIDEQPRQTPEPPVSSFGVRTAIFRAPLEIAEPVWRDETVPAPPAPETAAPTALETQFTTEEPAAFSETPHEHLHEHPHEHPHSPNSVSATSLDSFSLDDAAAGQVRFASELPEVVYAAPAEEAPAAESAPLEPSPEVTDTEAPAPEPTPEVVYTEPAAPEPTPEVVYAEAPVPEPALEAVHTEVAPPETTDEATHSEFASSEPTSEVVYTEAIAPRTAPEAAPAEVATAETIPEMVYTETAALEPAPEAAHTEGATSEAAPEAVHTEFASDEPIPEAIHSEIPLSEAAPEVTHPEIALAEAPPEAIHSEIPLPEAAPEVVLAGIASVGAAVEAIHAGIAHPETKPEVIPHEIAAAESVPVAIHPQEAVAEPISPVAQPEPASEVTAPQPSLDKELVHCIIEKVVLKMAPSILTAEAVEEITKRLTEEIVAEISLESSQSQA
jgi:CheY-like chemotaxis protein